MMMALFKKSGWLAAALMLFFSADAMAVPTWDIVPTASKLNFTATQNGAPVIGEFKSFSGDILFDPTDLSGSLITIKVNIASVTAAYNQVADTLKTPDWFDAAAFPVAVFKANHFTSVGDKKYTAEGTLTIREKTVPVTVAFTLEKYTDQDAFVKGTASLKRTAFGIGKGEWAKTDAIKDDVLVDFTLSAKRKSS
ncbi:MAG: YceI family protein [Gammaproteobacteria bacterium]|nr:YceI family protein [Gammaproteobacteria bacterium]